MNRFQITEDWREKQSGIFICFIRIQTNIYDIFSEISIEVQANLQCNVCYNRVNSWQNQTKPLRNDKKWMIGSTTTTTDHTITQQITWIENDRRISEVVEEPIAFRMYSLIQFTLFSFWHFSSCFFFIFASNYC